MNSKTTRQTHLSLWYTTAAVAAVGGGLACTANEAAASVIITPSGKSANSSSTLNDTTNGIWFKLNNDDSLTGLGTSDTSNFPGAQFRLQWLGSFGNTYLYQTTANGAMGRAGSVFPSAWYPLKLPPPNRIGPSANFGGKGLVNNPNSSAMSLVGSFPTAQWGKTPPIPTTAIQGYLGLRFATPAASGGKPGDFNYGWAEISIAANTGQPTLVSFGYNPVPNQDPPLSDVPEPNPLLLLATGAAGLGAYRAWRARRSQRQGSSVPEGRGI